MHRNSLFGFCARTNLINALAIKFLQIFLETKLYKTNEVFYLFSHNFHNFVDNVSVFFKFRIINMNIIKKLELFTNRNC